MTRLKSGPTGTQKSTVWKGLGSPGIAAGIGSTGTTAGVSGPCIAVVAVTDVVLVVETDCRRLVVIDSNPLN